MSYTTVSEIQADFKDITFDTLSNVKDVDVTQFIVEADALINSYIGDRYNLPIPDPSDGLQMLKLFSRCLVTARIKRIMEVKQDKSGDANQNVVGVLFSPTQIMKMLKDIRDSEMNLIGAVALSAKGFFNANVENGVEPVILKSEKQW